MKNTVNNYFCGIKSVFNFTLAQHYKSKATKITLALLMFCAIIAFPASSIISQIGSGDDGEITKIYFMNQTEFTMSEEQIKASDSIFTNSAVEFCGGTIDENIAKLTEENNSEVLILLMRDSETNAFSAELYAYKNSVNKKERLQTAISGLNVAFRQAVLDGAGMTDEQVKTATGRYTVNVITESDYSSNGPDFNTSYAVTLIYSIIILVLTISSSAYIIKTIVEEKTSKLVELLILSVHPFSLIAGKIAAVTFYIVAGGLAIASCGVVSFVLTDKFGNVSFLNEAISSFIDLSSLNVSLGAFVVLLISFVLGYLCYTLVAGLTGAGCSSADDVQSANVIPTIIMYIGYMCGFTTTTMGIDSLTKVCSIMPFISVFCAPSNYICGKIGLTELVISWVLQLAVDILLIVFSAKIYRELIFYNGVRLKPIDYLKFGKKSKSV